MPRLTLQGTEGRQKMGYFVLSIWRQQSRSCFDTQPPSPPMQAASVSFITGDGAHRSQVVSSFHPLPGELDPIIPPLTRSLPHPSLVPPEPDTATPQVQTFLCHLETKQLAFSKCTKKIVKIGRQLQDIQSILVVTSQGLREAFFSA